MTHDADSSLIHWIINISVYVTNDDVTTTTLTMFEKFLKILKKSFSQQCLKLVTFPRLDLGPR